MEGFVPTILRSLSTGVPGSEEKEEKEDASAEKTLLTLVEKLYMSSDEEHREFAKNLIKELPVTVDTHINQLLFKKALDTKGVQDRPTVLKLMQRMREEK